MLLNNLSQMYKWSKKSEEFLFNKAPLNENKILYYENIVWEVH